MEEFKSCKSFGAKLSILMVVFLTIPLLSFIGCKKNEEVSSPSTSGTTTTSTAPSETEPTETEPDTGGIILGQTKGYATESLRMRSGPGTEHEIVGGLRVNQEITILEIHGDWYKVLDRAQEGYVSAQYISLEKVSDSADDTTTGAEAGETTAETTAE